MLWLGRHKRLELGSLPCKRKNKCVDGIDESVAGTTGRSKDKFRLGADAGLSLELTDEQHESVAGSTGEEESSTGSTQINKGRRRPRPQISHQQQENSGLEPTTTKTKDP